MFTFLPGPFLVQFSGPFYLSSDTITDKFPIGPRQVQKVVKEIANRTQISKTVTPHILRHTFATLALQKNISLASVQKILGHDRLATTSIYLNFTDEHVVDEFTRKW